MDFGDEGTTIIPFSRTVDGSTGNGRCCVKWPDGNEYDAALVFTAKTFMLFPAVLFCVGKHFLLTP